MDPGRTRLTIRSVGAFQPVLRVDQQLADIRDLRRRRGSSQYIPGRTLSASDFSLCDNRPGLLVSPVGRHVSSAY